MGATKMAENIMTIKQETQDRYAVELYADGIIEKIGIRTEPGVVEDFKRLMVAECEVIEGADGVRKYVARETGKEMAEHALTDFRKRKPQFWHVEAPPDLSEQAFLHGNRTAAGQLVSAIGVKAAEAEAKKWGTDLYSGKPGRRPDDVAPPAPKARNSNPWSAGSWDLAKQRSLTAAIGIAKANSIAASADPPSFVGATKPGAKRLIPR
jgi:hypothetical protein